MIDWLIDWWQRDNFVSDRTGRTRYEDIFVNGKVQNPKIQTHLTLSQTTKTVVLNTKKANKANELKS